MLMRESQLQLNEREGKQRARARKCTLASSRIRQTRRGEVAKAMRPADDNNMRPGKLHSRYTSWSD